MPQKIDPNKAADPDSGIFGLPFNEKESKLVYIPVPWEVTTSYGGGTSDGPATILEASHQVDLFDLEVHNPYDAGLHMLEESKEVRRWNKEGKKLAGPIIKAAGKGVLNAKLKTSLKRVNELGGKLNDWVYKETKRVLKNGQIACIVGGDHSVPYGAFKAVGEKHGPFGILHFDAHSDTRRAYEGFTWSHASIMYNALENIPQIEKLVQVGIRDFCEEEYDYTRSQKGRVKVYFDEVLQREKHYGKSWLKISNEIVSELPQNVWISFDIDGLDPKYCPHTGTPVPGGLSFAEALTILRTLADSGRTILGFDLNEVAPGPGDDEWDGNVGARLLYKMTGLTLLSQGLVSNVTD